MSALWTKPGHPGRCPRCQSAWVQWTWKPDQEPISERVRCWRCGWSERRAFLVTGQVAAGEPVPPEQGVLPW